MAVMAAAQLLDELMGKYRNVAPNEKIKEVDWEDHELCKFFMVKFCPHDLFVNTRADLGPCSKVHDEEAKTKYENAPKTHSRKMQYMEDFLRFCNGMLGDVDRKIEKGKQRLALSGKNNLNLSNPVQAEKNQEQIDILHGRIGQLEQEMEEAGIKGNVEQAQGLLKLCDQLREERENLLSQNDTQWSATAQLAAEQEKQMEVCEVCGAFLIVGDAQQRIDDHLMGKQHMGYMRLKAAIDEVAATVKEIREEKRAAERALREQEKEKRKDKKRDREDKDEDKDKKERDRSRSRQKDRSRDRKDEKEDRDNDRDRRRDDRHDRNRNGRDDRDRRGRDRDRDRRSYADRDRHRYHGGSYRRRY